MKEIIFILIATFCFTTIHAEDINGFYVWVNGSSTCYQLEGSPKIVFEEAIAKLIIPNQSKPALELPVSQISDLKVVFGVYQTSNIKNISQAKNTPVRQDGKYILGGELVIIKHGKQYHVDGTEIK